MIIQIGQDDGVLHGGIPKLVVLTITDVERQITFPFPADQPIAAIYAAAQMALGKNLGTTVAMGGEVDTVVTTFLPVQPPIASLFPGKIQVRDLVRYTGAPSEAGDDLKTGGIYRVLELEKAIAEIIDDAAPTRIRLTVARVDIELHEKAKPNVVKRKRVFETSAVCVCGVTNALPKGADGFYRGQCNECNMPMEIKL